LYRRYPDQTFIWPHAGYGGAEQLETVLARHANVVATLSKKEKAEIRSLSEAAKAEQLRKGIVDDCGLVLPEWKALLIKYRDRLLFATDAHKDFRWRDYKKIVKTWRGILAQLPPEVAADVAYHNAAPIYRVNPRTAEQ
jgi:hypothetical protein